MKERLKRRKKEVEKRETRKRARKNFLPTLIVTFLLWCNLGFLIYFIDPEATGAVPIFFALIFMVFLFTFSTLLAGKRRGLLISLALTIFLILRYFGVGNIINFLLLLGIAVAAEIYLDVLHP